MIIHFPYQKNNSGTKNSILYKILSLGLLIVFSLSLFAQKDKYTITTPSLVIKGKPYTFSVRRNDNNGNINNVTWNFGPDAQPETSDSPTVEVTFEKPGIQDITLEIGRGGGSFKVNRQVYVSEMPDNIEEVDCYIKPTTTNWMPQLKATSKEATGENKVHILAQPFVGDIDGDGKSEVVTTNRVTSGYTYSDHILIFNDKLELQNAISTPRMHTNSAFPLVLVRLLPGDKNALIIIATDGASTNPSDLRYRLQAYTPDGTRVWTSSEQIFSSNTTTTKEASVSLVAGDINNDGIPEILAGDRIFSATNGALLSTLPAGGRGYRLLNTQNPTYMPLLADMDNDGQLEVVTGNTIYKVTNTNGTFKTTGEILSSRTDLADGFVSVADIDMDGQLDVVSIIGSAAANSKPKLVVWTFQSGTTAGKIIAGPIEPVKNEEITPEGVGGSRVFIGNVDDDKEPELFFSYASRLVRFDYDKTAQNVQNRLKQKWITTTSDTSGATTLSMFDFDQDGKAELVYRDETDLRIIDGENGEDRKTFSCHSATHSEYPVVVDFDRDGHADILVSGAATENVRNSDVRLYWFSGEKDAWAPARTVWNQHAYNAVHVKEDLTIPKFQFNPATAFAGNDKTIGTADDVYPYNSFLQQQTSLSGDGIPFFKAAKVEFPEEEVAYEYDGDGDKMSIKNVKVTNSGDAIFTGPLKITVYKDKVDESSKILTFDREGDIAKGQTVSVDFEIENFSEWLPVKELVIRINDAGDGKSFHRVCDSTDVESSTDAFMYIPLDKLAWADSYRKCEGGEVVFSSDAKLHNENVEFSWYTPAPGSQVFSTDTTATRSSLQLGDAGKYIFQATVKEHLNIRVTLPHLSVAPEVMYWRTDAQDRNWNNLNNWAKSAALGDNVSAVPAPCTRVYLPGNATVYPSLKDDKNGHTDWTHYGQPEVKEIVFRYGSELHYQHKLKYEKAYINYNWGYYANDGADNGQPKNSWENAKKLKRDTWHILAAPLKSMASGDFSLAGHPFSWQKRFEVKTTPGNVEEGDLSLAFPTNDIALSTTNNAIAVKMAGYQNQTGYRQENLEGLRGVTEIPYFENNTVIPWYPAHNYDALSKKSYFYYFDTKSLKLINSPLGSMNRAGEAYRFVYETADNGLPADNTYIMPLNTQGLGSSREVMVGNPLLAPIDAGTFAGEVNADKIDIEKGYKLLREDGTWEQKFFTSGNTIPAWKAFIVTLKQGASSLSFPLETLTTFKSTTVSTTVRASYNSNPAGNALYMQVLKGGVESGDRAILQNNQNTNNTEIRKMILPEGHEAPETFFLSSNRDLSYLIRNLTQDEKEIPIGVKSSDVRSRLSLEFRNIPAFTASTGTSMFLLDKHLNIRQDLTRNPVYPFTQQESGLDRQYVDKNRFVLQLGGETGTIGQDDAENGINITYQSGILKVTSDENIDAVSVYDLYGRLVFSTRSVNLTQYTHPVALQGKLLLVRIKTVSGKEKVQKIMDH